MLLYPRKTAWCSIALSVIVFVLIGFYCETYSEAAPVSASTDAIGSQPPLTTSLNALCLLPGQSATFTFTSGDRAAKARWSCQAEKFAGSASQDELNAVSAWTATGAKVNWTAPNAPGSYQVTALFHGSSSKIEVEVCKVNLLVRRNGSVSSDPSGQAPPGPGQFKSSAILAAGGIDTPEHFGDAQISVELPDGRPAEGVKIVATGVVLTGGQGPTNAPNNVTGTFNLGDGSSTGADGKATILKCFKSGNRTEETAVGLQIGSSVLTTAVFTTVWNENASPWSTSHFCFDQPISVSDTMLFDDGTDSDSVPISGHHVHFVTTGVAGMEWSAQAGEYTPVNYTESELTTNGYTNIVTWGPVSDIGGVYTGSMTIADDYVSTTKPNCDLIADSIHFEAIDDNAYTAK